MGFCLDSRTMLISLPTPRIQSIQCLIRETLSQGQATILKISQLLGSMVSTYPAVLAAPLHYRHLERAKITALRHSHNYNAVVTTSDNMRQDLTWWLQELPRHNGRSMQGEPHPPKDGGVYNRYSEDGRLEFGIYLQEILSEAYQL